MREYQTPSAAEFGFTLMEMSIVIAIIGLIIGGIMAGETMVRSSELQNTVGEIAKYSQAVKNFQDKYLALPGDFAGAEALWGTDADCGSAIGPQHVHTKVCNGDGNGHIGDIDSTPSSAAEWWQAWVELADAGMVDGNYSGYSLALGGGYAGEKFMVVPGLNTPAAPLAGAGFIIAYRNLTSNNSYTWPMPIGHLLSLCNSSLVNPAYCDATFKPFDAQAIDQKIDDGLPATGNVFGGRLTVCVTNVMAASAQYDTTQHLPGCPLYVYMNF